MATETQDRIKELQGVLAAKVVEQQAIADAFKIEDGVVVVSDEQKAAFQKNLGDIKELQGLIEGLKGLAEVEGWGQAPAAASVGMAAGAAGVVDAATAAHRKSLGTMFVESDEFKALQGGRAGYTMPSPWEFKGANMPYYGLATKDVYSDLPTGTPAAFGSVQRDAIVDSARRTVRVRDLFNVQQTSAAVIEFFRVSGFTNNASVVPERDGSAFGAKPQSGLTFVGTQAPVRTIAHWEAAHRNVLADEPQLRGIIDNELMYGLRLHEDYQILSGTGTGEDLTGILNTSGVQTYSWSAGSATPVPDNKADAIRRAATKAFLAYYEPTGVVVHPNDWEDMELAKTATEGQYLLAVSIALGGEKRVWRMQVVDTPAISEGTALVGAFGIGAQLYDREQGTIRVAEQHSDFFVRNAIVVLAEERLALAVKRPESFVKVTFDAAPS